VLFSTENRDATTGSEVVSDEPSQDGRLPGARATVDHQVLPSSGERQHGREANVRGAQRAAFRLGKHTPKTIAGVAPIRRPQPGGFQKGKEPIHNLLDLGAAPSFSLGGLSGEVRLSVPPVALRVAIAIDPAE